MRANPQRPHTDPVRRQAGSYSPSHAVSLGFKVHRLADYRGKVLVLEWTNHDCPFVRKHYGARTTPHMYIIDEAGRLAYMGGIDSITTSNPKDIPRAAQYVRLALEEITAGKPVSTPVTRPYGCSVKY